MPYVMVKPLVKAGWSERRGAAMQIHAAVVSAPSGAFELAELTRADPRPGRQAIDEETGH